VGGVLAAGKAQTIGRALRSEAALKIQRFANRAAEILLAPRIASPPRPRRFEIDASARRT